jgi:hypothetical protein
MFIYLLNYPPCDYLEGRIIRPEQPIFKRVIVIHFGSCIGNGCDGSAFVCGYDSLSTVTL